ncbi:PREDICTED: KRAB-A domain-containing protein 2-like isoform X2 [Polistes dominula]|uniref:KRAB-A domain-containing protein 2-like isoform X2 n=1 Tax=Polistes dominula TaxID=743375 RepID=A0ABM1J5B3_POLDO|nr:PREDICTED: KRAB-A domain-containing protein 2-like isoform X2 [Polistes dominula]
MDLIQEKFAEKLKSLPMSPNSAHMSSVKYKKLVEEVKCAKVSKRKKPKDFWLLKHYDVIQVQKVDKLIFPVIDHGIRYYVTEEELCEVLYNTHCNIGHAGRDRMIHELNKRYKNITQQQISLFLQCCDVCQQKKGCSKKAIAKPMVCNQFNSRCQLNLVDFQSQPDGEYKFFFVYQDHLTKFILLRPLTSKCPKEIAFNLVDIFTTFGAPCFLQSDNGREFCNSIINGLKELWPELHIVHGKSRHSQSQGSVERVNEDIENTLVTWMNDRKTTKWSEGLRFVQFMKNRAYHNEIKQSPYQAMFGCTPKVGISNCGLPKSVLHSLTTEEELESLMQRSEIRTPKTEHQFPKKQWEESNECTEQQIKKIKLRSDSELESNLPDPAVGDIVHNPVPDVDKEKTDARSVFACNLEITEEKLHQLNTQNEALKQLYIRSQLALCHEKLFALEDIPHKLPSLRTVASDQDLDNEQGFTRCHCTQKCKTKRCLCLKKGILCHWKCHEGQTCCNK